MLYLKTLYFSCDYTVLQYKTLKYPNILVMLPWNDRSGNTMAAFTLEWKTQQEQQLLPTLDGYRLLQQIYLVVSLSQ